MAIERIPRELMNETIDGVIDRTPDDSPMPLTARYGAKPGKSSSGEIKYSVVHGDPGMAPIISRGTQSPLSRGGGVSEIKMTGALISEKMATTEEQVNKLVDAPPRLKGALMVEQADRFRNLIQRNRTTREWMLSQIFFNQGEMIYRDQRGAPFSIDYNFPESLSRQLLGNDIWGTGSTREPVKDFRDMMKKVKQHSGSPVTEVYINSETLTTRFSDDTALQALLAASSHPLGVNILTDPAGVMKQLFNVPQLIVYDETFTNVYEVLGKPAADKLTLANAAHALEVGSLLTVHSGDTEAQAIVSEMVVADVSGDVVTMEDAIPNDLRIGVDIVKAQIPFLKDNRIVFASGHAKGNDIVEWIDSPVGMGVSRYGEIGYSWIKEDPDLIYTRIQRHGLWALKNTTAIGTLDVA